MPGASAQAQHVGIKPGKTILLIQSGAIYPDGPMVSDLEKNFRVVPFTGIAEEPKSGSPSTKRRMRTQERRNHQRDAGRSTTVPLSGKEDMRRRKPQKSQRTPNSPRFLRLAAVRAGAETIICWLGNTGNGK